jgi:3',5'-cyclic AMP phosphodiesterase CpdA
MARKSRERMPMYGWYDPAHLLQTGIRVVIATIFGEFLDRRELFGNRDDPNPARLDPQHDYSVAPDRSARSEIWIDFVADTGDGWDSTYAVARLLARSTLEFQLAGNDRTSTPHGDVVVFGGDEVYATASREEYRRRLIAPFEQAAIDEGTAKALQAADVYAIPGNHDWYDGLNAFMGLFCARRPGAPAAGFGGGRRIGSRLSKQTRSYFALKLPGNWWLLGADAQLSGYLDRGQVAFFDDVAQTMMPPGSNVILCAGMPSWSYVGLDGDADEVFRNYSYLEGIVTGTARGPDPNARRHNLRLVLTGDSHHYTRFIEGDDRETIDRGVTTIARNARCYLTWGGGGAFLHPTQQLRDVSFEWPYPPPPPVAAGDSSSAPRRYRRGFEKKVVYPNDDQSRRLSWRLARFVVDNPWFTALLFAVGVAITWALAGTADLKGQRLPAALRAAPSTGDAVGQLASLLLTFPWFVLACLTLIVTLTYFSAAQRKPLRWIVGIGHFTAHLLTYFAVFLVVARFVPLGGRPIWSGALLVLIVSVVTALLSTAIMAVYLWTSLTFFRRHWNEAFSALRIKDYKGFLRLHVDRAGALTVYPIALDTVPHDGDGSLTPKLIEPPIRLGP